MKTDIDQPGLRHLTGYLGVDPGASGGLAVVVNGVVVAAKMPKTLSGIYDWLSYRRGVKLAVVERIPTAIFGVGKSSMSKLYGNYQAILMALTVLNIPTRTVDAKHWQRALDIPKREKGESQSAWKNRLRKRAVELHRWGVRLSEFSQRSRGITLYTADAVLIAEYCRLLAETKTL